MKARNIFIVLFAVLMVFAFASYKNEPKEQAKPTPKPQSTGDVYQIEVTEGVDKDYWNRDKIKIEWEEEVNEGDVISLKYRSERDVYQWDIRDGSLKWVYETNKGSFTDPVLGDDGWWTLTYTFAKDINGATVDSNERFGVYFRGNFVTTDLFEIKDITLNGEALEIDQDNIKSAAQLNEEPVEHDWSVKNWSVLFATGTPGEVDKTPLAEKVVDGGFVTGAPVAKEGYTLSIFTDAARTIPFDQTLPITEEKIFYYAYVGVPRAITFELNGGEFPVDAEIPETIPNGDMFVAPANPTKEGVAFAAWCTDAELTKEWVYTDQILADTTFYAKYGTPRTVTFNSNGGSAVDAQIVADGYAATIPEAPTNGTKMFIGWYADAELTEAYNFSAPVTADITVYAGWINSTDVTINLNYTGAPAATTFKAALDVALAEDDENLEVEGRAGYIFEGWYTDAACTTPYDFSTVVTAPFTLYAKWTTGTMYRVTSTKYTSGYDHDKFVIGFQDAGVKAGDVVSLTYRTTEPFTKFSIRKNDPSTYSKWFHEKAAGTAYPQFFSSMETDEDGWTTVTYEFPEPSSATQAANIAYGDDGAGFFIYFLNSKMVPGAIMEFRAVTINGKEYELTAASIDHSLKQCAPTFEADIEDYEWTSKTVKFNMGVGDAIDDVVVEFGKKVTAPADPAKEGYSFAGWFKDAEFSAEFDFGVAITKDTTIYAKWVTPVTLTFNSNEGSAVEAISTGAGLPITKPADPTREGYKFVGWFKDAELTEAFDFEAGITESTTVYAKWVVPKTLTLNLNYAGAPEATAMEVEDGAAITAPKN
ncbi:MAG: InlB B-repeat-containing protein, partial [Spirochaetales bacterium]|nr:InlB B-repeat-containing protein [Spirochaetales bacterium]